MSFTYEIHRREAKQHRPGHFGFSIDGVDAEVTVEPAQFTEKSLSQATLKGLTGPELAKEVDKLNESFARKALNRRIRRLQLGLPTGGIDLGARSTTGISAGTAREMSKRSFLSEEESIERFLNRGNLKGLDKAARKQRAERKAQKHDSDAEWRANRAALIASREKDLKGWQAEQAKGNPKAARWVQMLHVEIAALKAPILAASHGFQYAYTQYLTAAINLASDDIRIWPLMTNTTLDTVRDAVDTFSDVTADEFDGANYSAGGLALDNQAVAVDDANDRAEFDADDEVVTALGAGTRSIQGVALGKFNTNTAGSLPLHWIEFSSNKTPDGSDFTFAFNAEGILQAADG